MIIGNEGPKSISQKIKELEKYVYDYERAICSNKEGCPEFSQKLLGAKLFKAMKIIKGQQSFLKEIRI